VDDFAWKKGQTYGTILVDLELHRPIDLLPDRAEATLEAWLRAHPEVEIISRDRGGEYAAAARKGAPQAQQVADRFHLLLNLRDGLKKLMERKQAWLPEVAEEVADGIPHKARGRAQGVKYLEVPQETTQEKRYRIMSPHLRQSARSTTSDALYPRVRRDNRYARYEAVRALQQQGFSLREISRRLGISRQTVRRFVRAESFPERSLPAKKASLLDPYKPYLLKRGPEGWWNGTQLYAEIKEGGYTGSAPLLRRFITELRKKQHAAGSAAPLIHETSGALVAIPAELPSPPQFVRRLSPTRASWLCVSKPDSLDEQQRQQVEHIRKGHRDLDYAYQLSQAFVLMLSERRGKDLDAWLVQAEHSGIAELKSFAQGLRRDEAAVRAAFSSPWSQGQVEAQVNCLKLQKRLMFSRANFDLLRLRVLRRM
jgi:transposase